MARTGSSISVKRLQVARIRRDDATRVRAEIDVLMVDEFAQAMQAGAEFPPVVVFKDGKQIWLADGHHRLLAAEQARLRRIKAEVHRGTRDDALWYAIGANQAHGLRRTNADKRRSVLLALRHPRAQGLSLRALADHLGVDARFVKTVRAEISAGADGPQVPERVRGKDGRSYPATRQAKRKKVVPSVLRLLRSVPVDVTPRDLEMLAGQPAAQQRAAAKRIAEGKAVSVRDALRQLRYEMQPAAAPAEANPLPDGEPFFSDGSVRLYQGDVLDVLRRLDDESISCVITSPPYWAKVDYGVEGQLGQEPTPAEYVDALVGVFREIRRVLRSDGTVWLNLGTTYMSERFDPWGLKPKDDAAIPHRVAFALQMDGWYLRSQIVWEIPNVAPESVTDRPTCSHQMLFLLARSPRYYYDVDAVREPPAASSVKRVALARSRVVPADEGQGYKASGGRVASRGDGADHLLAPPHPLGRNRRSVWTIPVRALGAGHPAPWPAELVEPCVLAGCPPGGVVLDPFAGTGTTLVVARRLGRGAVGIELNPTFCQMAAEQLRKGVERSDPDELEDQIRVREGGGGGPCPAETALMVV